MHTREDSENIDFRQYWLALRQRWLPAATVFGLVVALTAMNALSQKPVYEAKGRVLIKTPNNVTSAAIREESALGKPIGEFNSVGEDSDPLKTEVEVIQSTPILQKTISTLNLKNPQGAPLKPEKLRERLSVQNIKGTDILEVLYQSPDPEEAAVALNQVMNLYVENNILANRAEAATAGEFIAKQLPKTEATVRRAEVALRGFKEKNNVVALGQEAESAVEVIAGLENKITDAQAKLVSANAQSEDLQDKLSLNSKAAVTASSLSQSPAVQKALEELQLVESQLAVERARYQEAHPIVVELKSKRASLESLLQGRVGQVLGAQERPSNENLQFGALKQQLTTDLVGAEAERLGLTRQVSTLSDVLASYKQRASVLPSLEQQQRELERELTAAQSIYEALLRRVQEIRVEGNQTLANARIVEQAEIPEGPAARNVARSLALGGLLGVLLSIGIALILDALDTSIKTVKEARELFGYSLLGVIPSNGKFEKFNPHNRDLEQSVPKLVVRDTPRSLASEAYRMLQSNLKFLSSDNELKMVVVTSSVPQEGKSTLSANLAVAIAKSGRRVLLVDADMRRPRQHRIWDLLNDKGLSDVLVGQAELGTAIKEVMANLHVLTAGVMPPNPGDLLDSKRMVSLIENFSDNHDFVIIDTPSLNVAADAPILGRMVDGVLLVVRPGVIDSASAASAKELLEQSGQNILGQVINGVVPENEPYSHYYHAKEYDIQEDSTKREKAMSL